MAVTQAESLFADLRSRGIELETDGVRIRWRPESLVSATLAERIRAQRSDLIDLLHGFACTHGPGGVGSSRRAFGYIDGGQQYRVLRLQTELAALFAALDRTAVVGVVVITTGADPRCDRARLLSLCLDTAEDERVAYLLDCDAVDPQPLLSRLTGKTLVMHDAMADLPFLARLGFAPSGKIYDTMLLAQLIASGTNDPCGFADCRSRYLEETLDQAAPEPDWLGRLTDTQLNLAANEARALIPLLQAETAEIERAGLTKVAEIELRCLPAVAWMARHGVAVDKIAWQIVAGSAADEADRLRREIDRIAPPRPGPRSTWNWNSQQDVRQALALAGIAANDSSDETLAGLDHPLPQVLRQYRVAQHRASTCGVEWLAHVADDGRVHPNWRQTGAATGRMSCASPNMQQLPRRDYRRCVVAPPGRMLVRADYSQIELRIAAQISGDEALLEAFRRGDDLHAITARGVLGTDNVTSADRQLAKALNFGMIFGMSANRLRNYARSNYGVIMSESAAHGYRAGFFRAYPGLAAWHRRVRSSGSKETRTLTGRRRLLDEGTPDTQRLNTPVQGTGADGIKLALALLWERRDQVAGAFPVLAVHDEIVVEADADRADVAAGWLRSAMMDAMAPLLAPVPVTVEVRVSRTWGEE